MPSARLTRSFRASFAAYQASMSDLVPLTIDMAFACVTEALPAAHSLEVRGAMTEDWLRTLRIQRVLDVGRVVLFDIAVGDDDPDVEQAIDEANVEYLDLLLDLTGDQFMGPSVIIRSPPDPR